MAHHVEVTEEKLCIQAGDKEEAGVSPCYGYLLFVLGVVLAMTGGGHDEHGGGHASNASQEMVASVQQHEAASTGHEAAAGEHHGSPVWLKRVYTTLWMNNIFFVGAGIIGLFFVAIQYAAMAGWSVGVKRVGLAMGTWIPIAGILTLVLWFVTSDDVFHWTHSDLYQEGAATILSRKRLHSFSGHSPVVHFRSFSFSEWCCSSEYGTGSWSKIRKNMLDRGYGSVN